MESDLNTTDDSTATAGGCAPSDADTTECHSAPPAGEKRRPQGPDRRQENRVDRRSGLDRRIIAASQAGYTGPERRNGEDRRNSLERRRGPGRRLSDDRKAAEEGEMTEYQFEFVMAIETYKKLNKRMYPTWTEILEILRQLGYRKVHHRTVRLDAPEPAVVEP